MRISYYSLALLVCASCYSMGFKMLGGTMKNVKKATHVNIIQEAERNQSYRKELVTGDHSQVVLMSLKPQEDIGSEVHDVDQTLVLVTGKGSLLSDGSITPIAQGSLVFVPAGVRHNIRNEGQEVMKLYTIYAPAEHKPGTEQKTKPQE